MSTSRCMFILAVFAGIVGLCSIVFNRFKPVQQYSVEEENNKMFPGYFRTDLQEKEYETEAYVVQAHFRNTSADYSQVGFHPSPNCGHKKKEHSYTYNACCRSHTHFIDPKKLQSAMTGRNDWATVAQYPNFKQYFFSQECCQVPGCELNSCWCICSQTYYMTNAVVTNPDGSHPRLEWVRVPGYCQCVNSR
ncbi:uncharacterized protein [Littorina saxatilis]|uniref:Spaetzle domain-containing protein n=1 Tax=Littorina saxatilis TaxID=31220 RepID=A0AAN9BHM0_9CAEN